MLTLGNLTASSQSISGDTVCIKRDRAIRCVECLMNKPLKDSVITLQGLQIRDLSEGLQKQTRATELTQIALESEQELHAITKRKRWWWLGGGLLGGVIVGVAIRN